MSASRQQFPVFSEVDSDSDTYAYTYTYIMKYSFNLSKDNLFEKSRIAQPAEYK